MLTFKQVELYKAFCHKYDTVKNKNDFHKLNAYSFVKNQKVHILEYSREGIEDYIIKDYNPR